MPVQILMKSDHPDLLIGGHLAQSVSLAELKNALKAEGVEFDHEWGREALLDALAEHREANGSTDGKPSKHMSQAEIVNANVKAMSGR